MYRWIAIVVALLSLTACKSGGGGPIVTPPVDGKLAVLSGLPIGTAAEAALSGVIALDGLTLAPPVGAGTSASIMAKIIDPGDDILRETPIMPGNNFQIAVDQAVAGKLQLEFSVNEDVNGDGTTPDTVVTAVPIDLPLGRVASMNMTIRRGVRPASPPVGPQLGQAEEVFFPATGEVLLVDLTQSDASGPKSNFYAVTPSDTSIFDADGDRFIEAGDDTIYVDNDENGWPDGSEAAYSNADAGDLQLNGTVSAVSRVSREVTLRLSGSDILATVIVDPFASILPLAEDGTLLGSLILDQSLVGRTVQVYGLKNGAENRATLVVVRPVSAAQ
ncbi:MAG: hypothetical protein M3R04_01280 [bacterium]|nr:hypothetical protein [bacterium]